MTTMTTNVREFESQAPATILIRVARLAYLVSVLLLIAGIVLQVFFAGATLLVNASALIQHRQLGEMLAAVPVLILALAFAARLPKRLLIISGLPTVLFSLQYLFLYTLDNLGLPYALRALHAVNALVMFWVAQYLAKAAWKLLRA